MPLPLLSRPIQKIMYSLEGENNLANCKSKLKNVPRMMPT